MVTDYRTQQQLNDILNFGISLVFMGFALAIVKELVLDEETEYLPQVVTVECPICHKEVEVHQHNAMSRSEALNQHIKKEHTSTMGLHPQALLIEGGEPLPPPYRHMAGFISDPLPEYSLAALPAVEVEAGERKIDAVMKQLKDGVENIQDSSQFRLFLTTMSKFHDYSIGNLILIGLQKPDATRVAGFMTWKELGRWVKLGEKGIAILAPVLPPRPTCAACGTKIPKGARYCPQCGQPAGIEEMETAPKYFKVVHVFDISQTEGKPLPEFEVPVLSGEANEELLARLLALMKQRGVLVSFESRPYLSSETKGQYTPPNQIWIRPEEPRAQQLKTLLHEVAHYYSEGVFRMPRHDAETIAESAAYVVGAHYGFDTGVRSFPYVALWARDKKMLEQNLNAIRRVASAMLESLEKAELLPATIPGTDLSRIADKYGWWAARLAEAVCPHNDVTCVEREAKRLAESRKARRGI